MYTDYCTRQEFLNLSNDPQGAKYTPDDIDAAQREAVLALESWAYSAWPTVTGADGDGTALTARSTTEVFDGRSAVLVLTHLPIIAISTLTLDGNALVANSDYYAYPEGGYVRFGNKLNYTMRGVSVAYTYGFSTTPQVVKRPLMQAMKSLLDQRSGRSATPLPGLTSYTTETATFTWPRRRYNEQPPAPWAWDLGASDAIRTYWRPSRPVGWSSI